MSLGELVKYTLPNGDEFSVSTYNYYLSNFVLIDDKGNRFAEPESYHLAMADNPMSLQFTIKDVPIAQYKSIEFLIGVDSVRNLAVPKQELLDPKYGMIWSWSTGYIMAKMEGHSAQSSAPNQMLSYHIAGFKGQYNVLQKVKLTLANTANVTANKVPVLSLRSDLSTWFQAPDFAGFSTLPSVGTEGVKAFKIAKNYSTMMSIVSVQNP